MDSFGVASLLEKRCRVCWASMSPSSLPVGVCCLGSYLEFLCHLRPDNTYVAFVAGRVLGQREPGGLQTPRNTLCVSSEFWEAFPLH